MRQSDHYPACYSHYSVEVCCEFWAKLSDKSLQKDFGSMAKVDPLIQILLDCESRLTAWLNESVCNAELFRCDPLTAIRDANIGIDESFLGELEQTVTGIAHKLRA